MDQTMTPLLVDVVAATVPMLVLAAVTWRLVWPRWKLLVKLILHPCLYAVMAYYLGHLSVPIAWVHQGLFGLGGHIWFCRRAGFTWYRVEDPERYIAKSKAAVAALQQPRSLTESAASHRGSRARGRTSGAGSP